MDHPLLPAALAIVMIGCFPAPQRTDRPAIERDPWRERSVRSEDSCQTYRYLYAPGPGEDSPAMLLLPGGIFDNRIWLYCDSLAEHFSLYALDWPDNSPFYTGHASDLGAVARDFVGALGIEELAVAGISMGTYAAVDLAAERTGLEVDALILISSVMFALTDEEIEKRTAISERALSFSPETLRSIVERRAERADYGPAPGEIRQLDIFHTRLYPYYFQVFSIGAKQEDRPQRTQRIECPVLFVHGTDDETYPIEVARGNPTVFPAAKATEWIEIEGGRHSMVFARGPEVAAAIEEFLKRWSSW